MKFYRSIVAQHGLVAYTNHLRVILDQSRDLPQLGLNAHHYALLKRRILKGLTV